jgi:hypothetical protein
MVYNKSDFNKKINTLKPIGFESYTNFGSTRFVKKEDKRVLTIAIGYNEYFPHSADVKGISVDISFNEVEEVLRPVFKQSKVKGLYNDTTIHQSLIDVEGVNYKLFETEINNDDTFNMVAPEIKKMMVNGAIPFFERYQTVRAVFEDTEKMPIEQMSNFIGQPLPFRRLIIKKLCNDVGYEEYYKLIVNFYRAEGANGEVKLAEQLHRLLQGKG